MGRTQAVVPEMGREAAAAASARASTDAPAVRVVLQQFALPKYRVSVFRELASRRGIDFTLLYSEYPGLPNDEPDGFVGVFVPLKVFSLRGQTFWWQTAQWTWASRRRADVLILSWSTRYLSLIPALLRARLSGVPVILWGHGASKRPSKWRYRAMAMVTRLANAVLFYNTTHAERFIAATGCERSRVFVAPNALDQSVIQRARETWLADPARLDAFRRERGLGQGPVVLFVSRFEPGNRVPLLVEAAAKMVARFPTLKVAIIGKGEDEPAIRRAIAEHGLEGCVMLPGAIYNEFELAPYFLAADVFCYPRNIGLSLLHAFGYGLPVVTGDDMTSHNPEIDALRPGENGMLYKDGDAGGLADVLSAIVADRAARDRMAAEAHRTVMEIFSLGKMVDGFEAAIRYCVGTSRKRA